MQTSLLLYLASQSHNSFNPFVKEEKRKSAKVFHDALVAFAERRIITMKKNYHLHWQIHLCLIILLLLFCSSSQVSAATKINLKNTRIKLSAIKLTYNKKVQRPKIRVTYNRKVLKEKKNYIINYSKGCKKEAVK